MIKKANEYEYARLREKPVKLCTGGATQVENCSHPGQEKPAQDHEVDWIARP